MLVETTKNVKKYESYKYAFERLKEAIEREFFLEAVVIAESIISDRLISYLVVRHQELKTSEKLPNTKTSLGKLIEKWQQIDQKVSYKDWDDLIKDVDKWRGDRNECAHALVKSNPGSSTHSVEEFVTKSRNCALVGTKLARAVCSWTQSRKAKIPKI
ncbi:hypothetical protein NIES4075_17460 [Tolypothrix sp. NIES-4075]|uniref:hypothetical protein n=1 Tax=Tolypothrix sp. NIES-4075 TaxID=2005459 RepID=UPI000B5C8840|nr:hypothetical protein [Tolypothrix sp. NIES-4075]GAX40780.1 hypothetical protein NIES4075_17460 [Tolypothrix sp. NIES-4075]